MSPTHRRTALWIALAAAAGLAPASAKIASATTADTTGQQGQPADTGAAAPADTGSAAPADTSTAAPAAAAQPESLPAGHIEVQHVLIGFQGSVPGKPITRTEVEAKKLAHEILARAQKGESFDELVKQYTDDQFPGIYRLVDRGLEPLPGVQEYPRDRMVKGFSDCAFSLKIGQVGISEYSPATSKYGWHIIKRLR